MRYSWVVLLVAACGVSPRGRPVNLTLTKQLTVGKSTTMDVRSLLGKPFRARPIVEPGAFNVCSGPASQPVSERWWYEYNDYKDNQCLAEMSFDASQVLCRIDEHPVKGPLCSGAER